ncbi:SRPBCC family protein [Arthrobacter sp. 31Y]|uniref:SRPBCC family protein n=1 Tax=Arthrobacter sp. 31Y TaxID=1115632 RepID=UPI00214CC307|nr:SRPBCC domain-containing protein [Arthrobacter sp. 31Y]
MSGPSRDAVTSTIIAAPRQRVWMALTEPALIQQYFLGTKVTTTWRVGHPITYSGEYNGRPYQDKGIILACDPPTQQFDSGRSGAVHRGVGVGSPESQRTS